MANTYKYRADQIGKLVPPPDAADVGAEAALKRLFAMQKSTGIAVASAGEIGRHDLARALFARGMAGDPPQLFEEEAAPAQKMAAMPIKVSLPSAASALAAAEKQAGNADFDRDAAAQAVSKAIAAEIDALIAGGVRYIQLNGSVYSGFLENEGDGEDAPFAEMVALDRKLVGSITAPDDVRIAFRIGRRAGGVWSVTGTIGARAEMLLTLPAHRFLLAFRGEPEDFAVLARSHPKADVVLGLIDSDNTAVVDPEPVLALIDSAARVIDGDRLAVSPRGGFTGQGQAAWDAQRETLAAVADIATRWWGFAM